MERLTPQQLVPFVKRFVFRGAVLRVMQIANRPGGSTRARFTFLLREQPQGKRVRLRVLCEGVEEFRFQRRPGTALLRLRDFRIGYFGGLLYLNMDPFADDGPPGLHDFRASEAFIAARDLFWEVLPLAHPESS